MDQFLVGIDQGTTGTSVCLMDAAGQIVHIVSRDHKQYTPHFGWVEQNPLELWESARQLINQILRESGVDQKNIAGIGIANQGESVMLWDQETGQPFYNVLVWQDTRTQSRIDEILEDKDLSLEISKRTGLLPDSYFSASKIIWLLENVPDSDKLIREGRMRCGTLDSWLIWNLTRGRSYLTDVSTASRTMLLNIHSLEWDPFMTGLFSIPLEILPPIMDSTAEYGIVSHPDLDLNGIPILASVVDQPAAMVGQGCLSPGRLKATYGTGCFVNLNTGQKPVISQNGLLTMVAWRRAGVPTYGLDGGILTAGSTINWLQDKAGLITSASDIDVLCSTVTDSSGVLWIPAQVGLGAPHWDREVRGAWLNIDLTVKTAHLIRAVLEGISLRVVQVVEAMNKDIFLPSDPLRVDGGLTNSRVMMQIQADFLGRPVEVLEDKEATIRGVCSLAARQACMWDSDDRITEQVKIAKTYHPSISTDERLHRLESFNRAIEILKDWHDRD